MQGASFSGQRLYGAWSTPLELGSMYFIYRKISTTVKNEPIILSPVMGNDNTPFKQQETPRKEGVYTWFNMFLDPIILLPNATADYSRQ